MRFGVINWDAALPCYTYFGFFASHSLSAPQFHSRLPYYAKIEDGRAVFPLRTQSDFDRELTYAADAGIDYFAYCRYTDDDRLDNPGDPVERSADWSCLNRSYRLHQSSPLAKRIKYCSIVRPSKLNERDYPAILGEMRGENYEKIDGRPLAYFFGSYEGECREGIIKLKHMAAERGDPEPFAVPMNVPAPGLDLSPVDALSRYACTKGGISSFSELAEADVELNQTLASYGKPTIPLFSSGWDPRPRIERPMPWVSYEDTSYASPAVGDDFKNGVGLLLSMIKSQPESFPLDHILTFAWNEFEEGGWLCPNLSADGKPDTTRLDNFARAIKQVN